jgi:hypothetical protein
MASTLNNAPAISTPTAVEPTEDSGGMRFAAHYCALEEMVGLVFGVLTVAYILLSLTRLTL